MTCKPFVVVGFDLAWAGEKGWAKLHHDGGYSHYETGVIKPKTADASAKSRLLRKYNWDGEVAEALRADSIIGGLGRVLSGAERSMHELGSWRLALVYESALHWLLSASRRRGRRKPATRNSLMASAFSVACFWAAVGVWIEGLEPGLVEWLSVTSIDTRKARATLGVGDLPGGYLDVFTEDRELMKGYDDPQKAAVGLAVSLRLEQEGFGRLVPPTDHEADAACFAFVRGDEVARENKANG
jgi:hypothetical protein